MNEDCPCCGSEKSMFQLKWTPDGHIMACIECGHQRLGNKQVAQKELKLPDEEDEEKDEEK